MPTYYIKTSGGTGTGLDDANAWSLAKLNSTTLSAGDIVLFKKGDVFSGSISINASGTSGNIITYGSYGTGAAPIFSGGITVDTWTNEGNGIYSFSLASRPYIVTVNGAIQPIGRYPRSGYNTIVSSTSTTITDGVNLTGTPNYTGGEIVLRTQRYLLENHTISGQSGSTITFSVAGSPQNGWGYFIQNHISTLTALGDWCYSSGKLYMYFGANSPSSYNVVASSINTLVDLTGKSYITLNELNFQYANTTCINLNGSTHITIQNCSISNTGQNAVSSTAASTYLTIANCTIDYSMNDGVVSDLNCSNTTVSGCTITNTATVTGMGKGGSGNYNGIQVFGANSLIQNNTVFNTGGGGISFSGNNTIVQNNVVHYYAFVKDDGGGIYNGQSDGATGKVIQYNIIYDGIGAGAGTPFPSQVFAQGIYIDGGQTGVSILNNTVFNCSDGIKLHSCNGITVINNTCYGNTYAIDIDHDVSGSSYIRNLNIQNNLFIAKTGQYTLRFNTLDNDVTQFGTIDHNVYARPTDDNLSITTHDPTSNPVHWYDMTNRTLNSWQTLGGYDANSTKSPKTIVQQSDLLFYYNPTSTPVSQSLVGKFCIDFSNGIHTNSVSIPAYSSVIMVNYPGKVVTQAGKLLIIGGKLIIT